MDRTLPESTAKEEAASKLNYLIVVLVFAGLQFLK
jgi:hypothetical protein